MFFKYLEGLETILYYIYLIGSILNKRNGVLKFNLNLDKFDEIPFIKTKNPLLNKTPASTGIC